MLNVKKILALLIIASISISCKNTEHEKKEPVTEITFEDIINEDYELHKSSKNSNGVLVLFGGFPESAKDIKREFKILENAENHNISVLYMNYSQKIWLEQDELSQLSEQLQDIFKVNILPTDNVYIGGFSSGGNMALLISDFMTNQQSNIIPKGVFIVDSPIDLVALYNTAQKNIERNFSNSAVQESTWLLETLGAKFGNPKDSISGYEEYAIFTSKTNNINTIKNLKNTKIRLYTEPDTLWWKENTMAKYEDLNAYYIKKLSEALQTSQFKDVTYIPTTDKGYRSNGDRHPHSWAIIDTKNLINWMLN
ncbi:hypothetical protein [Winogradskyella thalassocola]|uniref:Alpha/beta hydrolase family protein n=1 Tax=Winogradskyella thalassocola TaxID=262004 RepID=A0A1G7WCZ5_9FLAO|nr:hypothetical protein [Winogradskyella thalassocola]SDG69895.1 hypothetical protein SAMN04489796_101324 [Winogradskyella thalassocola]